MNPSCLPFVTWLCSSCGCYGLTESTSRGMLLLMEIDARHAMLRSRCGDPVLSVDEVPRG